MEKRGQLTIFIILGIVIIAGVLIFFLIEGNIIQNPFSQDAREIQKFVEKCIGDTGKTVVFQVTEGGGYYFSPEIATESGIPYYLINGNNFMPPKENIEKEINFWVAENLFFCTRNFVEFPNYEISQGEIKVESEILDKKIILNVNYPLTIKKDEDVSRIEDFKNIEINFRVGTIYNSIKEFLEESKEAICLSCLLEIVERNGLSVNAVDYDEETVVFFFEDDLNEENPIWIFANKYLLEDEE